MPSSRDTIDCYQIQSTVGDDMKYILSVFNEHTHDEIYIYIYILCFVVVLNLVNPRFFTILMYHIELSPKSYELIY
jgi:hypothetical protein